MLSHSATRLIFHPVSAVAEPVSGVSGVTSSDYSPEGQYVYEQPEFYRLVWLRVEKDF